MGLPLAMLWDLIVHRHRADNHAKALAGDDRFQERCAETERRLAAGELDGLTPDEFRERYL